MKIIKKTLSIFPYLKRKFITEYQDQLLKSVVDKLPNDYSNIKSQFEVVTLMGIGEWEHFPEFRFIYFSFPQDSYDNLRKRGIDFKITGIEIFSKKIGIYEQIELIIRDNLLAGYKIRNSEYSLDEFDLSKIITSKITKTEVVFPPNEIDLFYESLEKELKDLINPDEMLDIEFNNRTFYTICDLEDGNYLAIDKKKNLYSLVHDAKPMTKKMKQTPLEILIEIKENKFNKDRHL